MAETVSEICKEKHKRIDERLNTHDTRLNNHGNRIDKLEQFKSSTETEIKNLIKQIQSLVVTMRWFIGIMVGAFVSFFFYAVQNGLFK